MDKSKDFRLGQWQVSPSRGLIDNGNIDKRLTPKAVDVLLCLIDNHSQVVTRDQLMDTVWHGRAVSDEPLNKCIAELRRQFGDVRGNPIYIETIPKRGYRLIAEFSYIDEATTAAKQKPATQAISEAATIKWPMSSITVGGLLALIIVGLAWWQSSPTSKTGSDMKSVAVLPFASFSSDGDKEYFASGVQEELIATLSFNPNLDVRSRTSTLAFAQTDDMALSEIAAALNADLIVEGSVRHEGEQVRVTAQLIEAASDSHLWSSNYQHQLSVANLFAIQNQIAKDIAAALQFTLQQENTTLLPTQSLAAYDQFLLGKYHYRRQLPGDIALSIQYFATAVEYDSEFADAWDWLAYAYNHAATQAGDLHPDEAYPLARAAALRAIELDRELATALSLLGYIRAIYDRDWLGGEADLRRALTLNQKDSGTVWSLAHVLSILGKHEEAIRLTSDYANSATPSGRNHREVANRLIDAKQYKEAIDWLDKADAIGDEQAHLASARGLALLGMGDIAAAELAFNSAVNSSQRAPSAIANLAYTLAVNNKRAEAGALLEELLQRGNAEKISAFSLAKVYTGLNRQEEAIKYLQIAAQERDRAVLSLHQNPIFHSNSNQEHNLNQEPAFLAIIDSLQIPAINE